MTYEFVCLFHLDPPVMRSDGGAKFWTNPFPFRSCPIPSFPVVSLTFYPLICCLFEAAASRDNHRKAPYTRTQRRLFVYSIFIFLSRESDGGAIFWTNPHPLRSKLSSFPVVSLTSYHLICCLFEATKQR